MKWVSKEPKKDGVYLTYTKRSESFGLLMKVDGQWCARVSQGLIQIPSVEGIDFFLKIVRPNENPKVH